MNSIIAMNHSLRYQQELETPGQTREELQAILLERVGNYTRSAWAFRHRNRIVAEAAIQSARYWREQYEAERIAELRELERPEAERQTAESYRDLSWLGVGEQVQIAYGEAVQLAAEFKAQQEVGRKELFDLWDAEARDAEAGARFSVSGGEVQER